MAENSDDKLLQGLSALMDNEASELELHRLLKALPADQDLRDRWQRYQLAAALMRGEAPALKPVDLSVQIRAAVAAEPALQSSPARLSRLWNAAGRLAVAASVAAAVLVGSQHYFAQAPGPLVAEAPAASSAAGTVPAGFPSLDLSTRAVNIGDEPLYRPDAERPRVIYMPTERTQQIQSQLIEDYLNELMLQHAQNASHQGAQGLLPYARIAPARLEAPEVEGAQSR